MLLRALRVLATTAVTSAAVVALQAAPAAALPGPCPNGEPVCVYLPPGTYTLGNPVSQSGGSGPSSVVLLNHCDTTTGECDQLYLNLPGLTFASAPSALLTLYVPGEGVALSGTTPTLYAGLPSASLGSPALGLTLHVQGTTFVLWDTILNGADCVGSTVPPNPFVNGGYSPCGVNLTITV